MHCYRMLQEITVSFPYSLIMFYLYLFLATIFVSMCRNVCCRSRRCILSKLF